MPNKLREIFCPTKEQSQKLYDKINKIIKENYNEYGQCCLICKHSMNVQVHKFYDYTTCELDKSLEFGYGMGIKNHVCDKFEFCGYLNVEDDNNEE